MRLRSVSLSLLFLGAIGAGCATTSDSGQRTAIRPLCKSSSFLAQQAKEKNDEPSKPADKDAASTSDNPFRKVAATDKSTDASSGDKASDTKSRNEAKATADKGTQGQKQVSRSAQLEKNKNDESVGGSEFSPETLRLIESELADASPDERTYWYDQLKQVDPAVIPKILQARRLTAQIVSQRQGESSHLETAATDGPTGSRSPGEIRQTRGDEWAQDGSSVVHAVGRSLPGSATDLNLALHESDGFSVRQQIVQQGYVPQEPAPGRPHYAAQRSAEPAPSAPANATSSFPNLSTPRNALSRLLPTTRGGAMVQTSANSSTPVSLMPPAELERTQSWKSQLEPLIAMLEAEVAQLTPGDTEEARTDYVRRHVYLRLLYLMAQHPERALTAIPAIDAADQEFWQQTLWAMTNYFDVEHIPSAKDRAGQAAAQLATATQRLREQANLEIRNLAFCREIVYFGNFVRFPRDEFRAGDALLLYAEIENFKSELTVDGQYRTLLRSTIEIFSPSGEIRWQKEFPATEDLCVNYRRDYFHNYQFDIPDRLPLGPHTLKLTVFDELSGKAVSQSINFVVR
jgi:hypothetical protein